MAAIFPGQYNTFIPSLEGSKRLLVDFSRNPRDFSLNKYISLVPCPEMVGYYTKMTVEERMRILSTTLTDHQWPDGADAPHGNEGAESFEFLPFTCKRYVYPVSLGKLATDQAAWDIIGQHTEIKAQQAMTSRTQLVITELTTSGNWASSHTSTTTALAGGQWSAATTANLYIKKSIDSAITQILKSTGGVVKARDLKLVVNPNLAKAMAESQEMVDYLKSSPDALRFIRADTSEGEFRDVLYGLPSTYAGVEIVVEDAVKTTNKKGATFASSFVLGDSTPFITARPGSLVGKYGGPSFSTCTLFVYQGDDMTVETKYDQDNRKTVVRVVDNCVPKLTAGISGYLFTGAM
jgi:hypothetical protein